MRIRQEQRNRLGTAVVTLGTMPLVMLAFLPIGLWLLVPLEDRFPPPERLTAMVEVARRYPEARLLYTGAAASITRALLARQGFDASRVVFEPEARDTCENGLFSKRLADPTPGEQWLVVTSGRHMLRSVGNFPAVGWAVTPYPVGLPHDRAHSARLPPGRRHRKQAR